MRLGERFSVQFSQIHKLFASRQGYKIVFNCIVDGITVIPQKDKLIIIRPELQPADFVARIIGYAVPDNKIAFAV